MKEETRDLVINFTGMGIAFYARMQFSKIKRNWKQNLAIFLCSVLGVTIIHLTEFTELTKLCAASIVTLLIPNIVGAIIKGGDKSEEPLSEKISEAIVEKASHIIDEANDIKNITK